jgi:hypothetical protein
MPSAWGGGMTRHPGTGAAQQPAVAAREPVENRAAKRNPFVPVAARQPQVNGRELVDSFSRIAHYRETLAGKQ